MDWARIIELLGGTALIVAAIAWIAQSAISHLFSRELDRFKIDLQADHDLRLQDIQAKAEERLTYVKEALDKVERLEADLLKNRGAGYGEIWKLTGALNLFGPTTPVNSEVLSEQLKGWYFEHGWVLTQESKNRYFLVQEVLNFGMLRSLSFKRPDDEVLFSSPERPVEVLRQLRSEWLGIEARGDQGKYKLDELVTGVTAWKPQVTKDGMEISAERNWVLLQFVLSMFRAGVVEELGSRKQWKGDSLLRSCELGVRQDSQKRVR